MTTILSGGVSVRLSVVEPTGSSTGHQRFPAILLLHGAGGNVDNWLDRLAPYVGGLGISVYAVHYFDRTGTLRAGPNTIFDGKHVPLWLSTVRDALAHIAQLPQVDPTRIALLGISLGAYLSLALATLPYRPAIRAVVEISGGLSSPYAANADKRFPPTLIFHGAEDTVVPVSEAHALNATLDRIKVPHQLHVLPNEGHWFTVAAQLRMLDTIAVFLNQYLQPAALQPASPL